MNDLPDNVLSNADIKIFADDTKLYLAYVDNETTSLEQSLQNFCSWSETWQLSAQCFIISVQPHHLVIKVLNRLCTHFVEFVLSIRDLGMYLTLTLNQVHTVTVFPPWLLTGVLSY